MSVAGGKGEAVLEVKRNITGCAEQGEQAVVAKPDTYVHGPVRREGFVTVGAILDHHEIVVAQKAERNPLPEFRDGRLVIDLRFVPENHPDKGRDKQKDGQKMFHG